MWLGLFGKKLTLEGKINIEMQLTPQTHKKLMQGNIHKILRLK